MGARRSSGGFVRGESGFEEPSVDYMLDERFRTAILAIGKDVTTVTLSSSVGIFAVGFLLLVAVSVLVYGIMIYNSLVRLNRDADRAWSNIDVLLKQRSDELPKLIDTAQEYMDYEESVLTEITEARTRAEEAETPGEEARADEQLRGAFDNLLAVAEEYPELKANESFQQLQERIAAIEDSVADRREFYNAAVNTYNIRIHQIPYNLVAGWMGYEDRELFQADAGGRSDVDVAGLFDT